MICTSIINEEYKHGEASALKDILAVITENRETRGWTEYQLAERSGLPQSTISSWYRKNMITLSQLFAEGESPVSLTESQAKLLNRWARLDEKQQNVIFQLLDIM